tara:strand:- start:2641 stop:2934 length:294 start_codon:yes stop_codon:yes gene_type:complete
MKRHVVVRKEWLDSKCLSEEIVYVRPRPEFEPNDVKTITDNDTLASKQIIKLVMDDRRLNKVTDGTHYYYYYLILVDEKVAQVGARLDFSPVLVPVS